MRDTHDPMRPRAADPATPAETSVLRRAMILASLRDETSPATHAGGWPAGQPPQPHPGRARLPRSFVDRIRRSSAVVLLWLAGLVLRTAFRLYRRRAIPAGGVRAALTVTAGLERAGAALLFRHRRHRHRPEAQEGLAP